MNGLLDWMPPFGTLPGELARAGLVSLFLLLLFAIGEAWRHFGDPPAEWTRKLAHFGAGAVTAVFPWLFAWHWTVLILAFGFAGIIFGTRRLGLLQSIHGVARRSEGGIYYPIAIYLLFLLAGDRPVFYLISLLVLMVSDSLAALLGSEYGKAIYTVETDRRSLEGSVVFLLTTFLAVHLPLLLATDTSRWAAVLIAAQIALTVTIFEGISPGGSDNLVVPVATYILLTMMTPKPAEHIAKQLAAQMVITLLVALLAWRFRFLALSSSMGLALVVYGAYALGGAEWTIAPAVAVLWFAAFYLVARKVEPDAGAGYHIRTLFYVAGVPTLLFFANNAVEHTFTRFLPAPDPLYVPYVGAVAAQLLIVLYAHLQRVPEEHRRSSNGIAAFGAVLGFLVVVPIGLAVGPSGMSARGMMVEGLLCAVICMVSLALYLAVRRMAAWPKVAPWDLRLQSLSTALATALVLPVHLWRQGVL
jgi:phytol kinase